MDGGGANSAGPAVCWLRSGSVERRPCRHSGKASFNCWYTGCKRGGMVLKVIYLLRTSGGCLFAFLISASTIPCAYQGFRPNSVSVPGFLDHITAI